MNKHGWIEIIEAFFAILLVAGVILIMLNKGYFKSNDFSEQVYDIEVSVLREIQTNDTLREDIILAVSGLPEDLPVDWDNPNFPQSVKDKIGERTPSGLNCTGKICDIDDACTLGTNLGKDIYTQSVSITATLEEVEYRKLNLFCWSKG